MGMKGQLSCGLSDCITIAYTANYMDCHKLGLEVDRFHLRHLSNQAFQVATTRKCISLWCADKCTVHRSTRGPIVRDNAYLGVTARALIVVTEDVNVATGDLIGATKDFKGKVR